MFALLVASWSPLRADYRSAVSAYGNGAYEAALGEFRTLAQSGDPAAQYHLGLMLKDGRGVQKDSVAALGWFICAADSDGQIGRATVIRPGPGRRLGGPGKGAQLPRERGDSRTGDSRIGGSRTGNSRTTACRRGARASRHRKPV